MPTPSFQCSAAAGSGTPNGVGGRPAGWPEDVGILAIDLYFPYQYVDQVCNLQIFGSCADFTIPVMVWCFWLSLFWKITVSYGCIYSEHLIFALIYERCFSVF
jgi:hypothetical protein